VTPSPDQRSHEVQFYSDDECFLVGFTLPGCQAWNLFRTERHASVDRGTTLGMRIDRKRSIHEFQPLLHAYEAKPSGRPCPFAIKPAPESLTVR